MSLFSRHCVRDVRVLDGIWAFTFLGDADSAALDVSGVHYDDRLPVPSAYDAYPAYAGKRGVAAYRTALHVPKGKKAFLRFNGTGMWNRIVVDGKTLASFALPYSRVDVELPVSENETRELVVVNDNRYDLDRVPLQMNHYDFYGYGGIFRSVELHVVNDVYLKRVKLTPKSADTGAVCAELRVDGLESGTLPVTIAADGEIVYEKELEFRGSKATAEFVVTDAKAWSSEEPNLHIVHVCIPDDDFRERIGFRTVEAKDRKICVNGKPVKLLGYCRHEAHPQSGPVVSVGQMMQDLQLLRDLGCNFIRGSHYPQDPDFLDLCDEMGFYIWEETIGWGNDETQFAHDGFKRDQLWQTELMVEKSYHHPSVIMWGFLNEGLSKDESAVPLYRDIAACLRSEDQTRLVTYATMFAFKDLCYDFADVISVNAYPGWYPKDNETYRPLDEINPLIDELFAHFEKCGQAGKPFILSEIGAGAIYGWRDPLHAHWSEEYQADYLDVVCKRVQEDPKISGVALWQFCDCRTYSTGRALGRPRAFNNKGTFDEYRRPKMAAAVVKQHFSK